MKNSKKYRIRKVEYRNGKIEYFPEKKIIITSGGLWKWVPTATAYDCNSAIKFVNYEDCIRYIKNLINNEVKNEELLVYDNDFFLQYQFKDRIQLHPRRNN